MSLAISLAALVLSLSVFLHGRSRDKRDLMLRVLDELLTAEKQHGRRLLYEMAEGGRRVEDLTADEFLLINNALATLDLLGIYYRRRYVRRRDVLELWAPSISRVLPAAESFLVYRDAQLGTEALPSMRVLCRDAEHYVQRHRLTVRVPGPPRTPISPGTTEGAT